MLIASGHFARKTGFNLTNSTQKHDIFKVKTKYKSGAHMQRALKALNAIFLKGNTYRIWQVINKSPLIDTVAQVKSWSQKVPLNKRIQLALKNPTADKDLLTHLQEHGYVDISKILSTELLQELDQYVAPKMQRSETVAKEQVVHTKDFWIRLSDEDHKSMDSNNPLVKIALQESVLKLIGSYLGQAPFLEYVLLTLSQHTPGPLKSSQLWHHDHDNNNMLKMFIYLTDCIENEDGPFTLLPKKPSQKIKNSFFQKHLEDEEIYSQVGESNVVKMRGKKLTAFICNTHQCYHMGSRLSPGHHRLLFTALFIGLPSAYPDKDKKKILAAANSLLTPLQLAAIEK